MRTQYGLNQDAIWRDSSPSGSLIPPLPESLLRVLVDVVAQEELPLLRRLEWHVLILHVLENPLGVKDMEKAAGAVSAPMEVDW
jgi:hypothetical protein